jgi:hypothetical protein
MIGEAAPKLIASTHFSTGFEGQRPAITCEKFAKPEMVPVANPAWAIEASPACGNAGGHDFKGGQTLHATQVQLRVGCADWVKGDMKQGKSGSVAKERFG